MASIVIAGDTSGSVTLQAPAVAGSTVLNLPSTSGTIQTSGAGYTTNGVAYATSTSALATGSALTWDGTYFGIGTASPNTWLTGDSRIATVQSTGDTAMNIVSGSGNVGLVVFGSSAVKRSAVLGDNNANLIFYTNTTNSGTSLTAQATLTSAGNLGLGVTPSGSWGTQAFMLGKSGASNPTYPFIASTDSQAVFIGSNSYWDGTNWKAQFGGAGVVAMHQKFNYNAITWHTAPAVSTGNTQTFTTAMTLDSSGNLLVGTTALDGKFRVEQGGIAWARVTNHTYGGTQFFDSFRYNGTEIGKIQGNNSNVSYLTSSDYRLKENIAPMTGALAIVAQLKPCTYTWKIDGALGQGFIAHELQEVVPDCVSGEKDAVNEDGSIKPQGIDTSFLVATLTAALQEQQALINTLTDRISVLENK